MGAIGAAGIGAVGSLAGGLMSGGKGSGGSSSSQENKGPWAPQVPYVQSGLNSAQGVLGDRLAQGPYTGNLVAQGNPYQSEAVTLGNDWYHNAGHDNLMQTAGAAQNLINQNGYYTGNANGIANSGIAPMDGGLYNTLQGYGNGSLRSQGPNMGLSGALDSAAVNGANSLDRFNSGLQAAGAQGMSDPTQRIANDANVYANNPGVQASINSTNANIQDILHERTVPQLNRSAAMGGMLNSSRAGMAEAMANKDAALTQGSADASILNNAYNTGMSTASGLYASGLNSSINANSAGYGAASQNALGAGNMQQNNSQFNTTAQLGAANTGLNQGLAYQLGNANTKLLANAQLGSGLNTGLNAANSTQTQAQQLFDMENKGGDVTQAQQQAGLSNDYQKWLLQNQYGQGVLNDYWKIASTPLGTNGSTTAQSTLPPVNPMQSAVGGGLAGAGIYDQLFGGSSGAAKYGTSNANDPYNANGLTQNTLSGIASNAASSPYAGYQPPDLSGLY